jgi:FkbM family methyltransferase
VSTLVRETLADQRDKAWVLNVCGGGRLCLPAVFDLITTYIVLEQEDWFEDEIRFIRRWLRPGMRTVDVGANYGLYTVAMARAVGREGRVWAFEPTPDTAQFLDSTLQLNDLGQVTLSRAAVSSHEGKVALALETHSESNRIARAAATQGETIEVPAVTLTRAAEQQHWPEIDFIKLDIEGHEFEAVVGASGLLQSCSPLLMFEVNTAQKFDFRVLAPLAEMGYQFYTLLPGLLVLVPFDPQEPVDDFLLNVFACRPSRAAQLAAEGFLAQTTAASRATPSPQTWSAYAQAAPYSRELAARWSSASGSGADARTYRRGLAAFAQSRVVGQSAMERCAWLRQAMDCAEETTASSDTLACKISYARIAWEIGWRASAVSALIEAVQRVQGEALDTLMEPFLAPSPRYEQLAAAGQASVWLRCALSEQVEKLRAYSSIFVGDSSLSLLEPLVELPFCSPEMDRRCQLARIVAGRQAGPKPTPLLSRRSAENLNPEFWCGKAA